MRRFQLFELEDQPWFPGVIRDAGTAYLRFAAERSGQAAAIAPTIAEWLTESGSERIVDLCSGGAGPVVGIVKALGEDGRSVDVTLTDLFPADRSPVEAGSTDATPIRRHAEPVDARAVPAELLGMRTLFNALHHFRPEEAEAILASSVEARAPIAAVEFIRRRPLAVVAMFFAPLMVALALPFLRPFRWRWLPLTYLVPVIPLFVGWDGMVSALRIHEPEELRAMAQSASAGRDDYLWEVREIAVPGSPLAAIALLGRPR